MRKGLKVETAVKTSFRLSKDAGRLLTALSRKLGISKTSVIEVCIREKAKKEEIR
jgi:predicted DNA-binding protein